MYSVLVSKIVNGIELVKDDLKEMVNENSRVVILPWAFPTEINSDVLINEYFKKNDVKYNKYINSLKKIGIKEENIYIGNCYSDSKELLKDKIKKSDILLLPGGNPEMFYSKVVQETETLYDIKYYNGIIIGESAGCCLQFKRYFITSKNNYYNYFAWYDGFGVINDNFYVDVHSINDGEYLNDLKKISLEKNKKIYAICDDGALLLNRDTLEVRKYGNVITIGD